MVREVPVLYRRTVGGCVHRAVLYRELRSCAVGPNLKAIGWCQHLLAANLAVLGGSAN